MKNNTIGQGMQYIDDGEMIQELSCSTQGKEQIR